MKRSLFPLCILMAMLIAVLSITSVSYSWFEPAEAEGVALSFNEETKLRAENCTVATYKGTKGNNIITYETNEVKNEDITLEATGSVDNVIPSYVYFKTVISNKNEEYDSVVSLYLPSFTPTNGSSSLCVAVPTNSVRTFSEEIKDIHIIRNAYIRKLVHTDANPGQLIVEWFVKCESGSVTFNPSQVYLMYS